MTTTPIYIDRKSQLLGLRSRVFREGAGGGVEWMFAVDWAGGARRWYGYGMQPELTIAKLRDHGMILERINEPSDLALAKH